MRDQNGRWYEMSREMFETRRRSCNLKFGTCVVDLGIEMSFRACDQHDVLADGGGSKRYLSVTFSYASAATSSMACVADNTKGQMYYARSFS